MEPGDEGRAAASWRRKYKQKTHKASPHSSANSSWEATSLPTAVVCRNTLRGLREQTVCEIGSWRFQEPAIPQVRGDHLWGSLPLTPSRWASGCRCPRRTPATPTERHPLYNAPPTPSLCNSALPRLPIAPVTLVRDQGRRGPSEPRLALPGMLAPPRPGFPDGAQRTARRPHPPGARAPRPR